MKQLCVRWTLAALAFFTAFTAPGADTLQRIREEGVLKWGADAEGGAPYVFPDPDQSDRLIGFEVELADALAKKLGVRAEMVQNQWDALVPGLERGTFDIALNGIEITDERRGRIAMSRPYYVYAQQIATRAETRGLTHLENLRGKKVGTLSGTVAQELLEKVGGVEVSIYPGQTEPFRDLANERLDAVLLDLPIVLYCLQKEPTLKRSGEPFGIGYYGIGVRKEDEALLAAINKAIGEMEADGTLEKIYQRYGLWDANQSRLKTYQPGKLMAQKRISTWREWYRYLPRLLKATVITIELSVAAMILAIVFGLGLALARLFGPPLVQWLATAYIEVIRGTPLLIQLYLIYYGLGSLGIEFLKLNPFVAAVLGLGLNYAAYEAENYRAGIQSVPSGQMEAALALGMPRWLALRRVVLPQAIRLVIPPVTNDFIALFKDSSLVSVITMVELTKMYGMIATETYDYIGIGLMTAAVYFCLSYPASLFARNLEKKLRHDHR